MTSNPTDELLIHQVVGDGVPVVFLHGFLESKSMWESVCQEGKYKALLIDLPGHGKSVHVHATNSMKEMAKEVKRVIDQLQLDAYVVVGHSMGGYVALELMKLDVLCKRVLLLNSNFWADSKEKKADRKRVANIVKTNKSLFLYEAIPNLFFDPVQHDSEVKGLIQEALDMDAEAIAACAIAMSVREDNTKWIAENEGKVTIVQGRADRIVPEEMMREKLAGLQCKYVALEGIGHMAHLEAKEAVNEVLADFVHEF